MKSLIFLGIALTILSTLTDALPQVELIPESSTTKHSSSRLTPTSSLGSSSSLASSSSMPTGVSLIPSSGNDGSCCGSSGSTQEVSSWQPLSSVSSSRSWLSSGRSHPVSSSSWSSVGSLLPSSGGSWSTYDSLIPSTASSWSSSSYGSEVPFSSVGSGVCSSSRPNYCPVGNSCYLPTPSVRNPCPTMRVCRRGTNYRRGMGTFSQGQCPPSGPPCRNCN